MDEARYPLPGRISTPGTPLRPGNIGSLFYLGFLSFSEAPPFFLGLSERCPVLKLRAIRRQAPGECTDVDLKYYAALRIGNFITDLPFLCSRLF